MITRRAAIACGVLVFLVLAVYLPVLSHDYQTVDDNHFLQDAPYFSTGITLENIKWAVGFDIYPYWCPLAWLSHMVDCELFGDRPGLHLLHSVVLFALMSVLLFLALEVMTGAFWRSFFVAGLFALHPINVETVAWLTERHNLLAGLFFTTALLCYAHYCLKPKFLSYLGVLVFTAASLGSKTSLMTMPFVLLLFDYWPMKRLLPGLQNPTSGKQYTLKKASKPRSTTFLLVEKLPIAVVVGACTLIISSHLIFMPKEVNFSLSQRLMNIPVAYISYIGKLFWPQGLAPFYPFPVNLPAWKVAGSTILLSLICLAAFWQARRRPYIFTGWFLFFGVLVPIIGIVKTTITASADRFIFVPAIGIFIIVSWGAAEAVRRFPALRRLALPAGVAVLAALALASANQVRLWKNSETLYTHALSVTENNFFAWMVLGQIQLNQGNYVKAIEFFEKSIKSTPDGLTYQPPYTHMGTAYHFLGEEAEAEKWFLRSMQIKPGSPGSTERAMVNLASIRINQNRLPEALALLNDALASEPSNPIALTNKARVFANMGRMEEATTLFEQALRTRPHDAAAASDLEKLLDLKTRLAKATRPIRASLAENPDNPELHNRLGLFLEKHGYGLTAIQHFEAAVALRPGFLDALNNLGLAFLHRQNSLKAREIFERAYAIDPAFIPTNYNMACLLAAEDRPQEAVEWLKKTVDLGFTDRESFLRDEDLKSLRNQAELAELVRGADIPESKQ